MKELSQLRKIPPLVRPGQSGRKQFLTHAGKESVQNIQSTHIAYIITQYAYKGNADENRRLPPAPTATPKPPCCGWACIQVVVLPSYPSSAGPGNKDSRQPAPRRCLPAPGTETIHLRPSVSGDSPLRVRSEEHTSELQSPDHLVSP